MLYQIINKLTYTFKFHEISCHSGVIILKQVALKFTTYNMASNYSLLGTSDVIHLRETRLQITNCIMHLGIIRQERLPPKKMTLKRWELLLNLHLKNSIN